MASRGAQPALLGHQASQEPVLGDSRDTFQDIGDKRSDRRVRDQALPAAPATFRMSVLLVVRCGVQLIVFLNPSLSRKKVVRE